MHAEREEILNGRHTRIFVIINNMLIQYLDKTKSQSLNKNLHRKGGHEENEEKKREANVGGKRT